jgi:Helix-turn-helix domain
MFAQIAVHGIWCALTRNGQLAMTVLYRDTSTKEILWWQLSKQGKSTRQIGREWGVSHTTVRRAIKREDARRKLPKFRLLIPRVLTPQSPCPHDMPIVDGERAVCLICHVSGWDGHPDLAYTEPVEPEKPKPPSDGLKGGL